MTTNINPDSGIAYGYVSADALDSDIVDELMYGRGAKNLSTEDAIEDFRANHMEDENGDPTEPDELERMVDEYACDLNIEEPMIEGTYAGVNYATSWLGGALNFFLFLSPFTTDKARRASPCVPNAAILDTLDGDVTGYDVPADWRYTP